MFSVKETFTEKRKYIIPVNKQNEDYKLIFVNILNNIVNRIQINHKVWKLIEYNSKDYRFLESYILSLLKNILLYNNYGIKCTKCNLISKEFNVTSVSKNNIDEKLVILIISFHIDNIPDLFTIEFKVYLKKDNIPVIYDSNLIGISYGDKTLINKIKDGYDYLNIKDNPKYLNKIVNPNAKEIIKKREKNNDIEKILNKNTGKLEIRGKYKCYDSEGKTKFECENAKTIDGKDKPIGTWDRPCVNNTDCPFYIKGNKGICKDGICVMPKGVKRKGSSKFVKHPDFLPKCKNCIGETENCCFNQIDKKLYKKQSNYIFN